MADFWTGIGDMLGLNKGKGTIAAGETNLKLLEGLDPQVRAYLEQSLGLSRDITARGKAGADLYADALNINGPDGGGRARAAFQHSPGYEDSVNAGLDAIGRRASSLGMLQSGNTGIDFTKYATGEANKEWGGWLDRLAPYNDMMMGGVDRQIGGLGDLADWATQLTSGKMAANNQIAGGQEAGQGSLWDLLGNVAGVAGSAFGLNKGFGGFGKTPGGGALFGYGA